MRYCSHYIWESGSEEKENSISLVLQQASRKKQPYLLACVCDGQGDSRISGYFTERLVEWFHRKFLEMVLKKSCRSEEVQKSLFTELKKIEKELEEFCIRKGQKNTCQVWGILLWGELCWIFQRGEIRGYLFNRRYNRIQRKILQTEELSESGDIMITHGRVQKRIGILICTPEFGSKLSEEEMIQVLFEETLQEKQIEKRLREILMTDQELQKKGTGAVYIRLE